MKERGDRNGYGGARDAEGQLQGWCVRKVEERYPNDTVHQENCQRVFTDFLEGVGVPEDRAQFAIDPKPSDDSRQRNEVCKEMILAADDQDSKCGDRNEPADSNRISGRNDSKTKYAHTRDRGHCKSDRPVRENRIGGMRKKETAN